MPRSVVIRYGIDLASIDVKDQNKRGPDQKKVCFAFVGRFVPEKGIPVFLNALSRLRQEGYEFEGKLIGDGPERSNLEKQIISLQLESLVVITGYLSGEALAAEVAKVTVVVMPSIWEETAGLSAIEQMARGRLVIASDIGGLAEIVGEDGLSFPPGDSIELASRMKLVIENPALIEEIGERARIRLRQEFMLSVMIQRHATIYRTVYAAKTEYGQ